MAQMMAVLAVLAVLAAAQSERRERGRGERTRPSSSTSALCPPNALPPPLLPRSAATSSAHPPPAIPAGAAAQRPSDLLGNLPPAGDLAVAHYFPEHPGKSFPAGDIVSFR